MKRYILCTFLLLCILKTSGFASDVNHITSQINTIKTEIDSGSVSDEKKALILSNVNYLESRLIKKIKKNEARLANFKNNLNISENGIEVQNWLKKIESAEKKNKSLKEVYMVIELLKLKLVQ